MEAEDDSHQGANVVTESLTELEGLITVFRESEHHNVGDVGNLSHNDEKVLLDIIGDLVWSASHLAVVEAEVLDIANGVNIAAGDALGNSHDVSYKRHHLVHVEFILNNHAKKLNNLLLGLLG